MKGPRTEARISLRLVALSLLFATACSSSAPGQRQTADAPREPGEPTASINRTLVMIARGEPANLGVISMVSATPAGREIARLFFATLDFADERGNAQPMLEEAVPQLNTDTWKVLPDGRMETTYRLRPNLTWHDGTPLVAEDFLLGWQVYSTPAMGVVSSAPLSYMQDVTAPDERTIVIAWKQPYPDAARLMEGFTALPRHLLESSIRDGDIDAFANHPYWTQQYVGLGPYKLDRWEPGTFIEARAFPGHVLGKPKIERIRVSVATDPNAALAAFLSGEAHIMVDSLVKTEDVAPIKRNGGIVISSPLNFRVMQVQLRPELAAARELSDVHIRRAIIHALDKDGVNDALFSGQSVVTPALTSPLSDYYQQVEPVLTKYPYDPRQAQQVLREAGLTRGSDGFFSGLDGTPLTIEVETTAGPLNESENVAHRDALKQVGLNTSTFVLSVAMLRDNQAVASFSGLFVTGRFGGESGLGDYATISIPRPENRWLGSNRGGWSNATYDRAWDAFNTRLDRTERLQQILTMERLFSEDAGAIPLYYVPRIVAHVPSLTGPVGRTSRDAMELVHIEQWQWVQ